MMEKCMVSDLQKNSKTKTKVKTPILFEENNSVLIFNIQVKKYTYEHKLSPRLV